jgi:uncharacterized membrane protein SirB2
MVINHIQFQVGISLPEFLIRFCTRVQCNATLDKARWLKVLLEIDAKKKHVSFF